jgi:hypothetical protein
MISPKENHETHEVTHAHVRKKKVIIIIYLFIIKKEGCEVRETKRKPNLLFFVVLLIAPPLGSIRMCQGWMHSSRDMMFLSTFMPYTHICVNCITYMTRINFCYHIKSV